VIGNVETIGARQRSIASERTKVRTRANQRPFAAYFTAPAEARIAALSKETPINGKQYTVGGIAAQLRCTERAVSRMVGSGRLPAPDGRRGGAAIWSAALIEPSIAELIRKRDAAAAPAVVIGDGAPVDASASTEHAQPAGLAWPPSLDLGEIPDELQIELIEFEPEPEEHPELVGRDVLAAQTGEPAQREEPAPPDDAISPRLAYQRRWHKERRMKLGLPPARPGKSAASRLAWRRRQGLEPKVPPREQYRLRHAAEIAARIAAGDPPNPMRVRTGHQSWVTRRARAAAAAAAKN
jgi:hypothetical protein